jgi:SAM-dependent methyltransferase
MKIGRLAQWYRWIEYAAFGRTLERSRFEFLPKLSEARRVLVLGEGDGRTLARLLALAPQAHFHVTELSPEMILLASARTGNVDRITFDCGDALLANWPSACCDAIVTHFFLDCFAENDARRLIRNLATALRPGGIWLIGEFAIPRKGWRRLHAQIWIGTMYRFFGITTRLRTKALPPIEDLMREAGMERIARRDRRAGLIVSEIWRRQG